MAAPLAHAASSQVQSSEDHLIRTREQVLAIAYEHAMTLPGIVDLPASAEWSKGQLAEAVAVTLCEVLADVEGTYSHDDMRLGQLCVGLAKTIICQHPNPAIPRQGFMAWAQQAMNCFEGCVFESCKKLPKAPIPKKRSELAGLVDSLTPVVIPSKRQVSTQPLDGGTLFHSTTSRRSQPTVVPPTAPKGRTTTTLGLTETRSLLTQASSNPASQVQKPIKKRKSSQIFESDSECEEEGSTRLPIPSPSVSGVEITPSNKMPEPAASAVYTPIISIGQASTPVVVPPFQASAVTSGVLSQPAMGTPLLPVFQGIRGPLLTIT